MTTDIPAGTTVTLPADTTIRDIAALHEPLAAALRDGTPVHLDAGAVEEADLTVFQLLLSAAASARGGAPVTMTVPRAPAVRDLARLCGLAAHLDNAGE